MEAPDVRSPIPRPASPAAPGPRPPAGTRLPDCSRPPNGAEPPALRSNSCRLPAPDPQPGPHAHVLGPGAESIASVRTRETVAIQTADCFGGRLTREDPGPQRGAWHAPLNPLTGPIWIEGAEPGDTLVVRIVDIRAVGDRAVSCLLPFCGGLTATHEAPTLAPQLPERVWVYERTPVGSFAWRDRWEIPWAPFFGTIGTAPP